jgi:3-oxoacyl-[acyl-carrier protein] reductase
MGSSVIYCAAKAALASITKSLARALAPEIRVNAIAPGFVDTGFVNWSPEVLEHLKRITRLGVLLCPKTSPKRPFTWPLMPIQQRDKRF